MSFAVVIPARLESTRLPRKVLADIGGAPMLARVVHAARLSGAREVIVATDSAEVDAAMAEFEVRVVRTGTHHQSGTDRIAEAVRTAGLPEELVIVNVQGDEPGMPPEVIAQVAEALLVPEGANAQVATASTELETMAEFLDPSIVKVVTDGQRNALYFSRAPIPWARDAFGGIDSLNDLSTRTVPAEARRHLGIYAYRQEALQRFAHLPPCPLERLETLEQLRAMDAGMTIRVVDAVRPVPPGVDTPADLEAARARHASHGQTP